jgi:hypothetical protein
MNTNRAWLALGVLAAGAMLASCGGETAATPDAIPSTSPTPAPAATPTPVPNPGSVGAFACRLPASSNPRAFTDGCPEERGQLADYVNAAIDKAMRERPELFNFAEMNGPSPRVVDRERYHRVVAENLVQSGVCTIMWVAISYVSAAGVSSLPRSNTRRIGIDDCRSRSHIDGHRLWRARKQFLHRLQPEHCLDSLRVLWQLLNASDLAVNTLLESHKRNSCHRIISLCRRRW